MPEPVNAGISAEAQHVINSLEAHFEAVKRAATAGTDGLVKHAEAAWAEAVKALEKFELKFARAASASEAAGTTAADSAVTEA